MVLDPKTSFAFRVTFDKGEESGGQLPVTLGFTKISGIKGNTKVIEIKEVSVYEKSHRFPGRVNYGNVRLERGIDTDRFMLQWWAQISGLNRTGDGPGRHYKMDVFIESLDHNGVADGFSLRLFNAWPSSVNFGDLDAQKSDIWIHSVELANDGFSVGG